MDNMIDVVITPKDARQEETLDSLGYKLGPGNNRRIGCALSFVSMLLRDLRRAGSERASVELDMSALTEVDLERADEDLVFGIEDKVRHVHELN